VNYKAAGTLQRSLDWWQDKRKISMDCWSDGSGGLIEIEEAEFEKNGKC